MDSDRRNVKRGGLTVRVKYVHNKRVAYGFSDSVSTGGMFIATERPVAVGEEIEVYFTVPKSNVDVNVKANVRWVRVFNPADENKQPGMGIKFEGKLTKESKPKETAPTRINNESPSVSKNVVSQNKSALVDSKLEELRKKDAMASQKLNEIKKAQELTEQKLGEIKTAKATITDKKEEIRQAKQEILEKQKMIEEAETLLNDKQSEIQDAENILLERMRTIFEKEKNTEAFSAVEEKLTGASNKPNMSARSKHKVRYDIKVELDKSTTSNFFVPTGQDLASGGLFVASNDFLPIGEFVQLEFDLPNVKDTLKIVGKVCLINQNGDEGPSGMGVQFVDLKEGELTFIKHFSDTVREPYILYKQVKNGIASHKMYYV